MAGVLFAVGVVVTLVGLGALVEAARPHRGKRELKSIQATVGCEDSVNRRRR
jgi:hypothetical protein